MVENYLSPEEMKCAFDAGMAYGMSKSAGVADGAIDFFTSLPPALLWTAGLGIGAGSLGAWGYDALKERMTKEDPVAKFNSDVEEMIIGKEREKEDERWMSRVIAMRDELKRGHKKMPAKEYAARYRALVEALKERS